MPSSLAFWSVITDLPVSKISTAMSAGLPPLRTLAAIAVTQHLGRTGLQRQKARPPLTPTHGRRTWTNQFLASLLWHNCRKSAMVLSIGIR